MPKMVMTFHFRQSEFILLEQWLPQSMTAYLLSLLAVFALSLCLELLRVARAILFRRLAQHQQVCCPPSASGAAHSCPHGPSPGGCPCVFPLSASRTVDTAQPSSSSVPSAGVLHLLQTLLHFLQFMLGLCLMLIAMTYNVPIFLALLLGHSIGYLLCGPLYQGGLAEEAMVGGDCCS